jgi:hypothetical protein
MGFKATPIALMRPSLQVYYSTLVKRVVNMKEQHLIPPLIKYLQSQGYITCTEYRTPWAIPDILAVYPDKDKVQQRLGKGQRIPLTRELYWEILKLIPDKKWNSHIEIERIAESVGLSPSYLVAKILGPLRRNKYIEIKDGKCVKINGFHSYSKTLISVEAKVKDWKRAGEQALRHQKFVNQAYVALPSKHIKPALKNLKDFKESNLGLFEIGEQGQVVQHFTPAYRKPTLETMYSTALDSLWASVQLERGQECFKGEPTDGNSNSKSLLCSSCSTQ